MVQGPHLVAWMTASRLLRVFSIDVAVGKRAVVYHQELAELALLTIK